MIWTGFNGSVNRYGMFDDDDDLKPDVWIIRDIFDNEIGRVEWIAGREFPFYQIEPLPLIKSIRSAGVTSFAAVPTYSSTIFHIMATSGNATTRVMEAWKLQAKPQASGMCKKCQQIGKFIRTALICPQCHGVIGGF